MSFEFLEEMELGSIVDFVMTYNQNMDRDEKESSGSRSRKATQADWDRFFG